MKTGKKIIRQAEGYRNINIHFSLPILTLYGPLIQFFEELEGGASGVHIITLPSFSLIVTSIIRTICIHIIIINSMKLFSKMLRFGDFDKGY